MGLLAHDVSHAEVRDESGRFKLNDKASWFALGDYPSVTLGEAREKCEAARKLVKEGINPVQNRQIERIKREQDSATTFEAIAKE